MQTTPGNSFLASRLKKGGNFDGFILGGLQEANSDEKLTPDLGDFDSKRYQRSNSIESPLIDFNFQSTRNFAKTGVGYGEASPEQSRSSLPSFGSFKKIATLAANQPAPNKALLSVIKESVCEDNLTFHREHGELGRLGSEEGKSLDQDYHHPNPAPALVSQFHPVKKITSGTGDNQYPFSMRFLEQVRLGGSPLEPVPEKDSPHLEESRNADIRYLQNRERIASIDCPKPTFIETPLLRDRRSEDIGDMVESGTVYTNWRAAEQSFSDGKDNSAGKPPDRIRSIEPRRINTMIMEDTSANRRTSARFTAQMAAGLCGLTEAQMNASTVVGGSKEAVLKTLQDLNSQRHMVTTVLESINARIETLKQTLGQSEGTTMTEPSSPFLKRVRSRVPSIDGGQQQYPYLKMNSQPMETSLEQEVAVAVEFVPVSPNLKDSFATKDPKTKPPLIERGHAIELKPAVDIKHTDSRAAAKCSSSTQTEGEVRTVGTQTLDRHLNISMPVNKSLADFEDLRKPSPIVKLEAKTWHVRTPKNYKVSLWRANESLSLERNQTTDSRGTRISVQRQGGRSVTANRGKAVDTSHGTVNPTQRTLTRRDTSLEAPDRRVSKRSTAVRELLDPYIADDDVGRPSKQRLRNILRPGVGKSMAGAVYRQPWILGVTDHRAPGNKMATTTDDGRGGKGFSLTTKSLRRSDRESATSRRSVGLSLGLN